MFVNAEFEFRLCSRIDQAQPVSLTSGKIEFGQTSLWGTGLARKYIGTVKIVLAVDEKILRDRDIDVCALRTNDIDDWIRGICHRLENILVR